MCVSAMSVAQYIFTPKEKESSRKEKVFQGAYAELLPRSTNPLLVRTCKPTLPSSLMSIQKRQLHVSEETAEAPDVWYTSFDTQLKETKEVTNFSHVPEHNTGNLEVSRSSNSDQFEESSEAEKKGDTSEKLAQSVDPSSTEFETSAGQPYSSDQLFMESDEDMGSPDERKHEKPHGIFESTNQSDGDKQHS
jgi:hypothetical protein